MAALFLFFYIPIIAFALLFGPGPDGVLKVSCHSHILITDHTLLINY